MKALRYATLGLLTLLFVSPLLFMISTSFKTRVESSRTPPTLFPEEPTLQAYAHPHRRGHPGVPLVPQLHVRRHGQRRARRGDRRPGGLRPGADGVRGRKVVFGLIVATLFVPPVILVIPNYEIVGRLFWLDTLTAVIVPTAANAFGVFFLRQFFIGLPKELEESAYLDGANTWQVFAKVVLPLSRPALATLALLAFLTNWNDFLWPVYVLFSPEMQTLQAGLSTLQSANNVRYDLLMAGAVIASVPVLILYAFAQRFVIEGVSRSGLKG